jgi:hypothetical protein
MFSKKDLASECNVSLSTVTRTLKSCNLDHKRDDFSEEEKARFKDARQMLDNGMSFDEVATTFGSSHTSSKARSADNTNGNAFDEAILKGILENLDMRAGVISEVAISLLPQMIEAKLQEKAQELLAIMSESTKRQEEGLLRQIKNITDESQVDDDQLFSHGLGGYQEGE